MYTERQIRVPEMASSTDMGALTKEIGHTLQQMGDALDARHAHQGEQQGVLAVVEGQARRAWNTYRAMWSQGGAMVLLDMAITVMILNHR